MSAKARLGQMEWMKSVAGNAAAALVFCASVQFFPVSAQTSARPKPTISHVQLKPMLTGTDGSVTGIANFQGNHTTITATGNQLVSLAREPNCSLTLATGTYSEQTGSTDALTGTIADNYELVLHSEAGLTTTPDVFASGCVPPTAGFGAEQEVFVGTTTSGLNVFVGVAYDPIAGTNGIYVVTSTLAKGTYLPTGAFTTNYALNVYGFSTASAVTAADLDKDGNGDLVVTNSVLTTSGSVSVLLGNADGTFKTAVSYPLPGQGTVAAVIDDVNGDGKLDIIAVSSALGNSGGVDQQISVLLGKGDGTFKAAQSFTVPALPGSTTEYSTPIGNLITADVRGSGKKDLITDIGEIFLGNGDGTFTPVTTPAFPYQQNSSSSSGPFLATGDLNKDGKLDLIVGNGTISTYFGKGDGTFTAAATYASIGNFGEVTASDLDGDGNLDIYNGLANGGVYVGDGDDPNLSYALMGYGDGTFAGAPYVTGTGVYSAYTGTNMGDVNGDGLPDLVALGSYSNNVLNSTFTVYLGSKKGIFTQGGTINIPSSFSLNGTTISGSTLTIQGYAVADLNSDGKADLMFITSGASSLSYSGLIYWTVLSNGDGTFGAAVPHQMPQLAPAGDNDAQTQTIAGVQLAPLTKGGKVSILFSFYEDIYTTQNIYLRGFMVLPGNGDGTFSAPAITYSYNSTSAPSNLVTLAHVAAVADFNNDGKEDILTMASNGVYNTQGDFNSDVEMYLGNGDGTFAAQKAVTTAASISSSAVPCAVDDFNKDGKLDLVCPGVDASANPELAISLGNGDGTFAAPAIMRLTGGVGSTSGGIEGGIAAADFDGDGNVDIALFVFNSYSGIFYGKGDGTFTSVNTGSGLAPKDLINLAAGSTSIATDLNGDGKPDILAGSTVLLSQYGTTASLPSTSTALAVSASSIPSGTSVTLTATVTAGSGTPVGSVTFYTGTTSLGTGTLNGAGVATLATTALPVGSDSLTAVYAATTSFGGSTSAAVTVTVSAAAAPVATSTALAVSATTAVSGTNIILTATVTPASGSTKPTGVVTFYSGTTLLGTGMLNGSGVATLATTSLPVGSDSVTAAYGATTSFNASTSSIVTVVVSAVATPVATSTALTASATSAVSGTSITLNAIVTPASGSTVPAGTVTFLDGSTMLGTGTLNGSGVATYATSSLAVGTHSITASFGATVSFAASTSTAVSVNISAAIPPGFALSIAPASGTIGEGSAISTTITVTPSGGFLQTVTLTCAGVPANAVCAISPTTVTPKNADAVIATLAVQTQVSAMSARTNSLRGDEKGAVVLLSGGALLGWTLLRRRRRSWWFVQLGLALVLLAAGAFTGCSSAYDANKTPPGTYTLTVTGTSGSTTETAAYTLTVK